MDFGGCSSYLAETARPFMVIQALMLHLPAQNRVKASRAASAALEAVLMIIFTNVLAETH